MDSEVVPLQLRLVAAQGLAPYEYARVTDRRLSTTINLPSSNTVAQAQANINLIKANLAAGILMIEESKMLIEIEETCIRAIVGSELEASMKGIERTVQSNPPTLPLRVEGGLPNLPGTQIDMPKHDEPAPKGPWEPKP
jgi:hypothetical protein